MDRAHIALQHGGYDDSSNSIGANANDTDEAINGPIVFSCAKCRTIVGDTFAYAASVPERNYFGLQAVPSSVVVGKVRKMSSDQRDGGSVYLELTCAECSSQLGRRYITTTEDMDSIRNSYALDIDKVVTYELGKCLGNSAPNADRPPPEFYTSVAFHEDLTMVKSNVTAIAARLQQIEQSLMRLPSTSPRSVTPAGRKRPSQPALGDPYHQIDSSKRFSR
ncbi:Protein Mis18-alpha [Dipsacomyces acuminosporus]|nr:Protein Mis18-alpha [Dipsacomyces acuminosporus]